jgi:hypothetical protein
VQLEELVIEPATFRLVAQCLNCKVKKKSDFLTQCQTGDEEPNSDTKDVVCAAGTRDGDRKVWTVVELVISRGNTKKPRTNRKTAPVSPRLP